MTEGLFLGGITFVLQEMSLGLYRLGPTRKHFCYAGNVH